MTLRPKVADSPIFTKKSCSTQTFWSLLCVYDHHHKIMSYNFGQENKIICHPDLNGTIFMFCQLN
jgi:hypothetical protein